MAWAGERLRLEIGGQAYHLFVRDVGPRSEAAVLFLHGFPTSSLDWCKIAPRFSDQRALFVDLLGFGHSDKPRIDYSYPLQAWLITTLLATLGVRSVNIVAHDYSVTLAQELLRIQWEKSQLAPGIRRVIFLNGGVYGRLHRRQSIHRLLLTPVLGTLIARGIRPKALASGLNALAGSPQAWSTADAIEHWNAMAHRDGLSRLPRLLHYIADRQVHGGVWEAAMEAAADRIGFVWGPQDPVSGEHVLAEVRRRMLSSPVVALQGVGHYPHWERPKETADALLDLLGGRAR